MQQQQEDRIFPRSPFSRSRYEMTGNKRKQRCLVNIMKITASWSGGSVIIGRIRNLKWAWGGCDFTKGNLGVGFFLPSARENLCQFAAWR